MISSLVPFSSCGETGKKRPTDTAGPGTASAAAGRPPRGDHNRSHFRHDAAGHGINFSMK